MVFFSRFSERFEELLCIINCKYKTNNFSLSNIHKIVFSQLSGNIPLCINNNTLISMSKNAILDLIIFSIGVCIFYISYKFRGYPVLEQLGFVVRNIFYPKFLRWNLLYSSEKPCILKSNTSRMLQAHKIVSRILSKKNVCLYQHEHTNFMVQLHGQKRVL